MNPIDSAVRKMVNLNQVTAEQASRQLLMQSQAEFGNLTMQIEQLKDRREQVIQHIAAIQKVLEMSAPKLAPEVATPSSETQQ